MYGKLFTQMYQGTLATKGPWQALVTFQQLIILADKHGCVDMTSEAVSRITTIPLEVIEAGLKALAKPDRASRSPAENGKRIVPLSPTRDWGWRIVNYDHYRRIRSEEERREYHKLYMRERRAVKPDVKVSTASVQSQPIAVSSKQEAGSIKATTLASGDKPPSAGNGSGIAYIPLNDKTEFAVMQAEVDELGKLYPALDVIQTLNEIRGWNLANPTRRKTKSGIMRHIHSWFAKEQNKAH